MWKLQESTRVPIVSWADPKTLESETKRQIINLANLPFAFHHVALMADAHLGYGMPIGGVLASEEYIVPNAVGVDIGCGIVAIQTTLSKKKFLKQKDIIGHDITRSIPRGFHKHKTPQESSFFNNIPDIEILKREVSNAQRQLGTLGGGNHFVDILTDENDIIWIMVHSGSRNIGKKIADLYHKKAIKFTQENFNNFPGNDLAALSVRSKEGEDYITSMQFAQDFALNNRQRMLEIVIDIFQRNYPGVEFKNEINIHHNYASPEKHFGKRVWVHRKGAISAQKGQPGIVPGSMATNSYITIGKGNPDSFNTASHGAGRRMGRKEAKRRFSYQQVVKALQDKNVSVFSTNNAGLIEEFSESYKDVDDVMKLQDDLVEIKYKLFPVVVVIG